MILQNSPSVTVDLQSTTTSGTLDGDAVDIAPGIILRADPEFRLSGQFRSPAERLLELDVTLAEAGAWIGLHVSLSCLDLANATYVGFVCRSAAPHAFVMKPCLRSGLQDGSGFVDCLFDKHLLVTPRPQSHMDALFLDSAPDLPLTAPWRELILFLPLTSFRLDLHHLHPILL